MKLLNRTIRTYLICSILIICAGIPVFYFLLVDVIGRETAELMLIKKNKLKTSLQEIKTNEELQCFLKFKKDLTIKPVSVSKFIADETFRQDELDPASGELVPYTVCRFKSLILNRNYLIEFKISLLTEKALIKTILKAQFLVVALLLAGLFLVNNGMSQKIWEPFHITLNKLKEYEVKHSPYIALPSSGITEFELLNKAILQLVQKNNKDFVAQKEFTENAAHEMQTPLAILHSKLELLIQTDDLKEEQAEIMDSMLVVCGRLSRLNLNLLLLARIENDQFLEKEALAAAPIILTMMKEFAEQFVSRNITYNVVFDQSIMIQANQALLELLFSNIISNAIKYNNYGGKFEIAGNGLSILFTNTGEPVELDTNKIYERFFKSNTNQKSSGLGLAIVRRICDINGYQLNYSFCRSRSEHSFELKLC